jgi:hypothetical protein
MQELGIGYWLIGLQDAAEERKPAWSKECELSIA